MENVEILYKSRANVDKEKIADVYIFTDSRFGDAALFDSYLGIYEDGQLMLSDLDVSEAFSSPAYWLDPYVADVDGDGFDEIIVQQCVSITGGAGRYRSRIFKVDSETGEISAIFDSSSANQFDTGFRNEITEQGGIRISNIFTDMNWEYEFAASGTESG